MMNLLSFLLLHRHIKQLPFLCYNCQRTLHQSQALVGAIIVDDNQIVVKYSKAGETFHFGLEIWHYKSTVTVLSVVVGQ